MAMGKLSRAKKVQKVQIVNKSRKRKSVIYRPLIKNSYRCQMKYVTTIALDAGAVVADYHSFAANGIYDPDISGTGAQPLGTDQYLGVLYDHFHVLRSSIKATFLSTSSSSLCQGIVAVQLGDSLTPITTLATFAEQDRTSWRAINAMTSGNSVVKVKNSFNSNKFFANRKGDKSLIGDVATNPTELAYYHVMMSGINGSDPVATNVIIEIIYDVVFSEPKQLAQS